VLFEAEDAFEFAFAGGLQGCVDGGCVGGLFTDEGEVNYGDVGSWDADGEAVELAGGLRDYQFEGLGCTGGAGDHVDGSSAGAAEVLVREIEDDLVIGVAMNGGHDAAYDAEVLKKDFDYGCEAVGGAARVGDYVVLGGVILAVVHTEDDGDVFVGGRSGDDDLLDGGAEVGFGLGGIGEVSGGLYDDFCTGGCPVELRGVALSEHLEGFAVDGDGVLTSGDFVLQVAEDRVVLEKMREDRGAGEVVDGNELDFGIAQSCAENVTADSAEAVDSNLDCHVCCLLSCCKCSVAFRKSDFRECLSEYPALATHFGASSSTKPIRLPPLSTGSK